MLEVQAGDAESTQVMLLSILQNMLSTACRPVRHYRMLSIFNHFITLGPQRTWQCSHEFTATLDLTEWIAYIGMSPLGAWQRAAREVNPVQRSGMAGAGPQRRLLQWVAEMHKPLHSILIHALKWEFGLGEGGKGGEGSR